LSAPDRARRKLSWRFRTNVTQRVMGKTRSLFGLRSDGEEFPIEASISQIDEDGHKLFTAIVRDVSDKKRLEIS
jgi:PAS domain S-box-containing protein